MNVLNNLRLEVLTARQVAGILRLTPVYAQNLKFTKRLLFAIERHSILVYFGDLFLCLLQFSTSSLSLIGTFVAANTRKVDLDKSFGGILFVMKFEYCKCMNFGIVI